MFRSNRIFDRKCFKRSRWLSSSSAVSPIVIVGGGPTGLFLANLLQRYQTPFVLLESKTADERFQHPQAHFLNTRTMELLKHWFPESIHAQVQQQMRPVQEWNTFYFGPNMHSNFLAQVVHPVDQPLKAHQDTNGRFVEHHPKGILEPLETSGKALSDCTVGHLAQDTFCQILYDASLEAQPSSEAQLFYGNAVSKVSREPASSLWNVETTNGDSFQTPMLIAADGANSFLRKHLRVEMQGTPVIQHLINVHFQMDEDTLPPAMLYTVFSAKLLAMVVRHGPGNYVMQIPYFPPYQTIDDDFSVSQVQSKIQSAIGETTEFTIKSIRPWTMGSLVAERFYQDGCFLVGDAAHVFPPAGGFGMNTGLQDVHNLAWRLGRYHHHHSKNANSTSSLVDDIGSIYESERQNVARQNAALSVRNYHRVLGVTKSCYLYEKHPAALIAILNASGSVFGAPLWARQQTFRSLLQTAMWPLQQLKDPSASFTKLVTKHLQKLLKSGQGLPLLFPNHEIGFGYDNDDEDTESADKSDWSRDTVAKAPKLAKGYLFPHLMARLSRSPRDHSSGVTDSEEAHALITTRDLPAQVMANDANSLNFVLMQVAFEKLARADDALLETMAQSLREELGISCTVMDIVVVDEDSEKAQTSEDGPWRLLVENVEWQSIDRCSSHDEEFPLLVMIRPDGHVSSVVYNVETEDLSSSALPRILSDTRFCLGREYEN
jgi:2-polyprenyl-6-methoxyphenol hydroxylase-like FAD-dependent oxidoreductase